MMYVTVYINGRKIAHATAQNVSSLADISTYHCEAMEHESEFSPGLSSGFTIKDHLRRQSCWELVEKIAQEACARVPHPPHVSHPGKVCGYHDGCPPDKIPCHLCAHLQT